MDLTSRDTIQTAPTEPRYTKSNNINNINVGQENSLVSQGLSSKFQANLNQVKPGLIEGQDFEAYYLKLLTGITIQKTTSALR